MPFRIPLNKDFIGRSLEMETLFSISSEARKGIATSVFLAGQPGIGKTEISSQLFNIIFREQDEAAPFLYTVNSALISASDFSMDYLCRFIRQRIAFQKKDASLINADELSIENLMYLAEKLEAHWAVDIIMGYLQTKTTGDTTKLLLSAINAPYYSFLSTGTPVVVIIDDFHKTKNLYGVSSDDNKNLWMLFEESIKSRRTPHIITGSQIKLQEMFFLETSLGQHMELVNLSGLDKSSSLRLFTSLYESYGITVDKDSLLLFVDLFNGNPFYIRSFTQAVRHEGKHLSENDLWRIYFKEITAGKIYNYWISRLRTHMPRIELRATALTLLHHLCNHSPSTLSALKNTLSIYKQDFHDIADKYLRKSSHPSTSIRKQDVHDILNMFLAGGFVEMNFSTFKLVDDRVLSDVITGLYNKEILEEPWSRIEDTFIKKRVKRSKTAEMQSVEIALPPAPKAELIAVKALEQIAKNYDIPPEVTGDLQIAIIDLFTNIIGQDNPDNENIYIRFKPLEHVFIIEVKTPYKEFVLPISKLVSQEQLIRNYIDDIKIEKTSSGTKITLVKNLKKNLTSAS